MPHTADAVGLTEHNAQPIARDDDMATLYGRIEWGKCCNVIGVSTVAKSSLLRSLAQPGLLAARVGAAARRHALAHVDLNRVLHPSARGLCELVSRCLHEWLADHHEASAPELSRLQDRTYAEVVQPTSPLAASLAYNRRITAI